MDGIRRVADIMGEISAATGEQTLGIEQINEAIGQMDQTTQQNASLVEEAAAASETLQRQAAELADAVRVFKLEAVAAAPAAAPARAPAPTPASTPSPAPAPAPARKALPPMRSARAKAEPVLADSSWEAF
jgi:methyl-accepting chemotaxis protein